MRIWSLVAGLLLAMSCNQSQVGNMTGLVTQNGVSNNISVSFSSLTFPTTSSNTTFIIELSNLSDHLATFTLNSPNPSGSDLSSLFPTGIYAIASNGNSFTATVPFQGTSTTSITGLDGQLQLTVLQFGQDSSGNPAVAMITGEYTVDLENNGFVQGSFEADFTQ